MKRSSILFAGAAAALVALASSSAMAGCGTASCRVKTERAACGAASCTTVARPASYRLVREPAVYETRKERVKVRPAATTYRYIPPVYATRAETVLVRPASVAYRTEPAVYKTVTRKLVSTSCATRLVRHRDCNGCVTTCRVATPVERVRHVTDRVLVRDARRVAVTVPAEYATRKTLVQVAPGRAIAEHHPAEYIVRTVHVKVRDGRTYRVRIPAERSSCGSTCATAKYRG
jgi:hypothetical protein